MHSLIQYTPSTFFTLENSGDSFKIKVPEMQLLFYSSLKIITITFFLLFDVYYILELVGINYKE